jgi:hypothetical protein
VPKDLPPVPLMRGKFALYENDGGAILVYRQDEDTADSHQVIPAVIWRLMKQAASGEKVNPMAIVKALVSAGG